MGGGEKSLGYAFQETSFDHLVATKPQQVLLLYNVSFKVNETLTISNMGWFPWN
jgi:hypothetical protein